MNAATTTLDLAAFSEELRLGRRWVRNYTGTWHLCSKGSTETYCGRWLRPRGIERQQAIGAGDVPCERCAKVAPAADATVDLPRASR